MSRKITLPKAASYVPAGDYQLKFGKYPNGSTAMALHDEHGARVVTPTVALDQLPPDGYVLIKDWSENDGMFDALLAAGVIGPIYDIIPTGFVQAYVCELLLEVDDV